MDMKKTAIIFFGILIISCNNTVVSPNNMPSDSEMVWCNTMLKNVLLGGEGYIRTERYQYKENSINDPSEAEITRYVAAGEFLLTTLGQSDSLMFEEVSILEPIYKRGTVFKENLNDQNSKYNDDALSLCKMWVDSYRIELSD